MILWLEVDEIRDVLGSRALSLTRVTQTRARRANRFVFSWETVAVERFDFEMIEKEREAIVFLPLPIVERRQSDIKTELVSGVRRAVRAFQRQWRRLDFAGQAGLDKCPE